MTGPAPRLIARAAVAPAVGAAAREAFARAITVGRGADGSPPAAGELILVTCHRVEIYLVPAPGASDRLAAVDAASPGGTQGLEDRSAVEHLARVAVGLDSAILVEDQVLNQLRRSVSAAERSGALNGALGRATQVSLRAARRARTYRPARSPSLADRALDRLVGAGMAAGPVLVVGTGEMGRLAARATRNAGRAVLVASRDPRRSAALAATVHGDAVPFQGDSRLASVAGVIVALGGPWRPTPEAASALAASSGAVVDLSFPAAVPAGLAATLGPRYVPVDDLAGRVDEHDRRLVSRLEALVVEAVEAYEAWAEAHGQAAARALATRAEAIRRDALERLWRRLPGVPAEEREQIEGMARGLATALLGPPLARLGHDGDGARARAARDLFDL